MEFISTTEASKKWSISSRRIQILCSGGRLEGAERLGRRWMIPKDIEKPNDARIKSGKYVGFSKKYRHQGRKSK